MTLANVVAHFVAESTALWKWKLMCPRTYPAVKGSSFRPNGVAVDEREYLSLETNSNQTSSLLIQPRDHFKLKIQKINLGSRIKSKQSEHVEVEC